MNKEGKCLVIWEANFQIQWTNSVRVTCKHRKDWWCRQAAGMQTGIAWAVPTLSLRFIWNSLPEATALESDF